MGAAPNEAEAGCQDEQLMPGSAAAVPDACCCCIASAAPPPREGKPAGAATEAGDLQPFEPWMVAVGLSCLGPTADGSRPAYLRLQISGTTLGDAGPAARGAPLAQSLVLSNNRLTSLTALGALPGLASLDVSGNMLTHLLNLGPGSNSPNPTPSSSSGAGSRKQQPQQPAAASSLLAADFSRNLISVLHGAAAFTRLSRLALNGNQLERIGSGLVGLVALRELSMRDNLLASCEGLQVLAPSLRTLAIDGNRLASLAPLGSLTKLQDLSAARNRLASLQGLEPLTALRRLVVTDNCIGRLEEVAAVAGAPLLRELDLTGNALVQAMDAWLHGVHLLPQLRTLNGAPVGAAERLAASELHGAGAEALRAARRALFPTELDDGGGAVLPAAAGLVASDAEEERSLGADGWREACAAADAAAGAVAAAMGEGSLPAAAAGDGGGVAGVAAALAAQLSLLSGSAAGAGGPVLQLQLLRAVWTWVLRSVHPPASLPPLHRGQSLGRLHASRTWDVDPPLFGPGPADAALEETLLPGANGTWAERVAALTAALARAAGLEACLVPGYWRDGATVPPGGRLRCHNHCWIAAKAGGRWRLLDPACAIARGGSGFGRGDDEGHGAGNPAPFFTPPRVFAFTRLPLQPNWQLLPESLGAAAFWEQPEAGVAFFEAGGALLDDSLRAVNQLPPTREGEPLSALCVRVAFPWHADGSPGPRLRLRLLDESSGCEVAAWGPQQPAAEAEETHRRCSAYGSGSEEWMLRPLPLGLELGPLVFQQRVLAADRNSGAPGGTTELRFGAQTHACAVHELWAAPPAPGAWRVHLQLASDMRGAVRLTIPGLPTPMALTLRRRDDAVRFTVIVPPPLPHDKAIEGPLPDCSVPPAPLPAATAEGEALGACLLSPRPGELLEADRMRWFEVAFPATRGVRGGGGAAVAVIVGADGCGWVELAKVASAGGGSSSGAVTFAGDVLLPHSPACAVKARLAAGRVSSSGGSGGAAGGAGGFVEVLRLPVRPPVRHLVVIPDPAPLLELDPNHPDTQRWAGLLKRVDADGDGAASRRDMLLAFRRDRQLADHLRMPPRIRAGDGTFDRFLARFTAMNRDGLGYVDLRQLAAFLRAGSG